MKDTALTALQEFNTHRDRLFAIAYRMLGSVHDAEDIVQEAWLKWSRLDREMVDNPQALLCTMVTRMSIDSLRSARKQRETYVGEWLPEPLVDGPLPSDTAALAESLSVAFLLMLERLNPVERAALLLREVFGYSFAEVSTVLEKSEDNCRQIVRRAKQRVREPRVRHAAPEVALDELTEAFLSATRAGELDTLMSLLAEDATLHSDHGGKALSARRVIHGNLRIAKFFVGITKRAMPPDAIIRPATVNGAPGVITYEGGKPVTAISFEIVDQRIRRVFMVRNPDKLAHLVAIDNVE